MTIYKNGFMVESPIKGSKLLVFMNIRNISLYNKKPEEYLKFYHEEELTGLIFTNALYYTNNELEVLKNYSFIKHLVIIQKNITDISGIKYLNHLEHLSINDIKIDFDWLKVELQSLWLVWNKKKVLNFDKQTKLKELVIHGDSDEVVYPSHLIEDLTISNSKRNNLNHLAFYSRIKHLSLSSNSKITDIQGISHLSDSLESLSIYRCLNISDYTPILELKNLKRLEIEYHSKTKKDELIRLKTALNKKIEVVAIPNLD